MTTRAMRIMRRELRTLCMVGYFVCRLSAMNKATTKGMAHTINAL